MQFNTYSIFMGKIKNIPFTSARIIRWWRQAKKVWLTTSLVLCLPCVAYYFRFLNHCPRKALLKEELNLMECELSKLANPIVFCHNDLLLGNILYNESKKTINFIDFEYAAPNYQAYDIANHFCEFAGNLFNKALRLSLKNFVFVFQVLKATILAVIHLKPSAAIGFRNI